VNGAPWIFLIVHAEPSLYSSRRVARGWNFLNSFLPSRGSVLQEHCWLNLLHLPPLTLQVQRALLGGTSWCSWALLLAESPPGRLFLALLYPLPAVMEAHGPFTQV
jgi:hypothetical protein